MRIALYVHSGDEHCYIGTVIAAVVASEVHSALDNLWTEWREANPQPDTDSDFVAWLTEVKGWREANGDTPHVFNA